jgi:hypothetical protein
MVNEATAIVNLSGGASRERQIGREAVAALANSGGFLYQSAQQPSVRRPIDAGMMGHGRFFESLCRS